jgi:glycosyltransferase involved in cell wall biosynthesis
MPEPDNSEVRTRFTAREFVFGLGRHFIKSVHFLCDVLAIRRRYGGGVRFVKCQDSSKEGNRWQFMEEQSPRLTIVVTTYEQKLALDCLLKSLTCQTLQNFKVLVIHDGPGVGTRDVVSVYLQTYPKKFEYLETEKRFNDFGHSLRQIGIDITNTEFVLLTNGDNYYAPRFVEFMFEAIDRYGLDVVLCDMVHSHHYPGQPSYFFLRTRPFRNCVDIGCFLARAAMAKKAGFRDRSFSADATYFEDLLDTSGPVVVGKVDKVLMVHN